ncbi:uncharacterized protein LOC144341022 [Macaca mulatta]
MRGKLPSVSQAFADRGDGPTSVLGAFTRSRGCSQPGASVWNSRSPCWALAHSVLRGELRTTVLASGVSSGPTFLLTPRSFLSPPVVSVQAPHSCSPHAPSSVPQWCQFRPPIPAHPTLLPQPPSGVSSGPPFLLTPRSFLSPPVVSVQAPHSCSPHAPSSAPQCGVISGPPFLLTPRSFLSPPEVSVQAPHSCSPHAPSSVPQWCQFRPPIPAHPTLLPQSPSGVSSGPPFLLTPHSFLSPPEVLAQAPNSCLPRAPSSAPERSCTPQSLPGLAYWSQEEARRSSVWPCHRRWDGGLDPLPAQREGSS